MNKKNILETVQKNKIDEREIDIMKSSFNFGMLVVIILCCVLAVYKVLFKETIFEFMIIIFAYGTASQFYQFKHLKNKMFLIGAVCGLVSTIFSIGGLILL